MDTKTTIIQNKVVTKSSNCVTRGNKRTATAKTSSFDGYHQGDLIPEAKVRRTSSPIQPITNDRCGVSAGRAKMTLKAKNQAKKGKHKPTHTNAEANRELPEEQKKRKEEVDQVSALKLQLDAVIREKKDLEAKAKQQSKRARRKLARYANDRIRLHKRLIACQKRYRLVRSRFLATKRARTSQAASGLHSESSAAQQTNATAIATPPSKVCLESDKKLIELIENDLTCTVCLTMYINPVALGCCHAFCDSCVNRLRPNGSTASCPVCRTKIRYVTPVVNLRSIIDILASYMSDADRRKREETVRERAEANISIPRWRRRLYMKRDQVRLRSRGSFLERLGRFVAMRANDSSHDDGNEGRAEHTVNIEDGSDSLSQGSEEESSPQFSSFLGYLTSALPLSLSLTLSPSHSSSSSLLSSSSSSSASSSPSSSPSHSSSSFSTSLSSSSSSSSSSLSSSSSSPLSPSSSSYLSPSRSPSPSMSASPPPPPPSPSPSPSSSALSSSRSSSSSPPPPPLSYLQFIKFLRPNP